MGKSQGKSSGWVAAWRRKPVAEALAASRADKVKRVLGTAQLSLSGMGFVLGSGIFVLTGAIAAKYAGPAACLTFVLAAIPAALAALCYAEMVTLVPGGGGAYSYVSVGLGELPGFLTGWMLSLTYVGGCSLVGAGWAAYTVRALFAALQIPEPVHWTTAPWRWDAAAHALHATGGWLNVPAAGIIVAMAGIMLLGARESVGFTAFLVVLKLGVILALVVLGTPHIDPAFWHPFLPDNTGEFGHFGISGLLQGAGVAIFAYLGVDNICTAAQEAKEPQRTIPRAILITLSVCTVLYIAVTLVLTGLVSYRHLGVEDPIAVGVAAIGLTWLERVVAVGSIAGLTSVLLMQMYGLPRILLAMAKDGLAPAWAKRVNKKTGVPTGGVLVMAGTAATGAALMPVEVLGGVAANGTMLTFMAVSMSVTVLRRSDPSIERAFAVPFGDYFIPVAATVTCGSLVVIAPTAVQVALAGWLAAGVVFYMLAAARRKNSEARS